MRGAPSALLQLSSTEPCALAPAGSSAGSTPTSVCLHCDLTTSPGRDTAISVLPAHPASPLLLQGELEAASHPACPEVSLGMSRGSYHSKVRRKGSRSEAVPVQTQLGPSFCAEEADLRGRPCLFPREEPLSSSSLEFPLSPYSPSPGILQAGG